MQIHAQQRDRSINHAGFRFLVVALPIEDFARRDRSVAEVMPHAPAVRWLWQRWGIAPHRGGWCVCFGTDRGYLVERAFATKRRAKKEIWYMRNGCYRGAVHGAFGLIK